MNVKALKAAVISNNIPDFLIFVDNEPMLTRQYVSKIADTISKKQTYYDSAEAAIRYISDGIGEDFLFVVYGSKELLNNTQYADYFNQCGRNVIILITCEEQDETYKYSELYKKYEKNFIFFNKLDSNTILAYAQKQCSIHQCKVDQEKLIKLIERCEGDLGKVLNELDKIFAMGQDNSNILAEYLLNNGFSDYRDFSINNLVKKVLEHDTSVFNDVAKIETNNVVSVILALYNAAKNRIGVNTPYCKLIMKKCFEFYTNIINGTYMPEYALKNILIEVM